MNKTIKFRGKATEVGVWLYGDLVRSFDMKRSAILVNDKTTYDECEVDAETVGQFTGLHDKNGKEIYEGDIVRVAAPMAGMNNLGVIEWEKANCRIVVSMIIEHNRHITPVNLWNPKKGIEVLGNIYDNKDMIK